MLAFGAVYTVYAMLLLGIKNMGSCTAELSFD